MRAAWRLATSSLWGSGRRRRTALLAGAVALSAALIVGVACAMASIQSAIGRQLAATVGAADLRVRPSGAALVPDAALERVRAWPEVARAEARLQAPLSVSVSRPILQPADEGGGGSFVSKPREFSSAALALSLPEAGGGGHAEATLVPPPSLYAGRMPATPDEIVLDELLAYRLSFEYAIDDQHRDGFFLPGGTEESRAPLGAGQRQEPRRPITTAEEAQSANLLQGAAIGDEVEVSRAALPGLDLFSGLRPAARLKVVGIASMPPMGGRAQAYLTVQGLRKLTGASGFTQIDLGVKHGVDPEWVARAHRSDLPPGLLLETTDKVTAGLDRNMQSSQLGMVLATVMAFLSASFIIMTGLSTAVTERERELAIVRCIGGTRGQLARAQVIIGVLVGAAGAALGVPLGVGFAAIMAHVFRDQLPAGLTVSWYGVGLGVVGALCAGVLGGVWPALRAARVSPLVGLASRAAEASRRGMLAVTVAGLVMIALQLLIVGIPQDGQVVFWGYATAGLPLMFVGYFLMGVPGVLLVARLGAAPLAAVLRLPRTLLQRTIAATPYRHGFTAGALMAGLALMVAIWTNGGAILRDWLGRIQFPDAFVSGLYLPEAAQQKLASMDEVKETCAITLYPVETDMFGVRALQKYKTTFVGFEPDSFFRMTKLTWVQGDEAAAIARLKRGGAVIVAREFLIARGLGVGQRFRCVQDGKEHEFEIVGVVASPGLEIVSKFFNVGEDFTDQAVHAVFGSRDDMKAKFYGGEPAPIQLIQVQLTDAARQAPKGAALEHIRKELAGYGVLDVGSGIEIKQQIQTFARGTLLVFSAVAMASMLVACFGVANLIIAGVEARRYEMGVLRAIGAERGVLARLVAAEAVLIALTAASLGTLMGIQGSWAGQRLYALLLGLDLSLRPPLAPIAAAWAIVIALALLAAFPAILRLNRQRPRDLLGSTRG